MGVRGRQGGERERERERETGTSLHVPDLAEQRGELVLAGAPGEQHLGVVVVQRAQLRQPPQEPGEVLGLAGVLDPAELPQDLQHQLLEPLHRRLVAHVRPVCGGGGGRAHD